MVMNLMKANLPLGRALGLLLLGASVAVGGMRFRDSEWDKVDRKIDAKATVQTAQIAKVVDAMELLRVELQGTKEALVDLTARLEATGRLGIRR